MSIGPAPEPRWAPWWRSLRETWAALARPRRSLPILVVCGALEAAQWAFERSWPAVLAGAMMCLAFALTAPAAWRLLMPLGRPLSAPLLRLLIYAAVGVVVVMWVGGWLPRAMDWPVSFLTADPSLLVVLAFYWVGGWGLGRDIDLELHLEAARARAVAAAREAEQARLLAARQHLDPHFLFNTLNALAEWCQADPALAERGIVQLAGMLRTMLAGVNAASWPLSEELRLCCDLLDLHALRDPERFRSERGGLEQAGELRLPPLLLLPLVENAVKHGPAAGHRGTVCISLERESHGLRLQVDNPGPFRGPRAGGQGLAMVAARLELAYGGAARFEIGPQGPDRTRATLWLPDQGPGALA